MGRVTKRICTGVLLLSLTPSSEVCAQPQSQSTSPAPGGKQQASQPPSARDRIRTHVNEVVVPVTVTDKNGEPALDLLQKDFHVFDGGAEQSIDHFDLDGDPLAVALVIEASSHIQAMAPTIHGMGTFFTETVMALSGEAAVVTYDSSVDVPQPFTQDHEAIEKAIAGVEFQAPEKRLYDGMAEAVDLLKTQPSSYRRIMLVVGESQDYGSDAKLGDIAREAQLANITLYASGSEQQLGRSSLTGRTKNRVNDSRFR